MAIASRPVPRAGLSRQVVVAAAAEIADAVGFENLTLSEVAKRFGVAVPSLYKHVHGLDDLRRGVSALAIGELGDALGAAVRRSRKDRFGALARAYRRFAIQHPGLYSATLRAPDQSDQDSVVASQAVLDIVYDVLRDFGLTGTDAVDATRALRSALHGFVSLEAIGGFGMPRDVDRSFGRLVRILDDALSSWGASASRPSPGRGQRSPGR
jgi:AcrR family transcriptional regulator